MATSDRAAAGLVPGASATIRTEDRAQRRERRIGEFQASVRPRIASLTLDAPELEDLADSFPGLLFALAADYNQGPQLDRAITLTRTGVPLKHISDTLGLAWWLRRLPASAFSELMPQLPGEADFALRLGSFIPTDKRRAAAWLLGISDAYLIGGADFALWTARAWSLLLSSTPPNRAGLVAAWRWYSAHPGTMGHELLRGGWDPRLSTGAAIEEINAWLKRVALVEWLGTGRLEPWIPDAQMGAYEFRMLRRAEDFITTAHELTIASSNTPAASPTARRRWRKSPRQDAL